MKDQPMHDLITLNHDFGRAETEAESLETNERSRGFFGRYLHERLVFRRAGGSVADKAAFLADLAAEGNRTEKLTSYVVEVTESEDGMSAEVLVLVDLKGTRKGAAATGVYRNRRLFVKQPDGSWQCLMWFNSRVTAS